MAIVINNEAFKGLMATIHSTMDAEIVLFDKTGNIKIWIGRTVDGIIDMWIRIKGTGANIDYTNVTVVFDDYDNDNDENEVFSILDKDGCLIESLVIRE